MTSPPLPLLPAGRTGDDALQNLARRASEVLHSDDARVWQAFYPQACASASTLAAALAAFERAGPLAARQRLFAASFSLLATSFEPRYLADMRKAIEPASVDGDVHCALLQMLLQIALNNFCATHGQAVRCRQDVDIDSLYREQAAAVLRRMPAPAAVAPAPGPASRRVLIVASNLSVLEHPPTRLVLEHARVLRGLGHAVRIVSLNDELSSEIARHSGAPLPLARVPHVRAQWQQALGHDLKVWAARPEDPFDQRWQMLWQVLAAHRPDAVLYVGIGSAVMHLLHGRVPLMSLSTSGYPLEAPADVELLSNPPAWPHRNQAVRYAYRARIEPGLTDLQPRPLPGPPGGQTLISVGNRLGVEVAGPWAERMAKLLLDRPNLRWLLIGDTRLPGALAPVRRQVTCLPHQAGLGGFYKSATAYVNPPRLGGGLSVMEAMACGLPVVALQGGDGADKLGTEAVQDVDSYIERLDALLSSASQRAEAAARQQARCRAELDLAAAGPALGAALELAIERFRSSSSAPGV